MSALPAGSQWQAFSLAKLRRSIPGVDLLIAREFDDQWQVQRLCKASPANCGAKLGVNPVQFHCLDSYDTAWEISREVSKETSRTARALYLYAISPPPEGQTPAIFAEGIDGSAPVETIRCQEYLCWVSHVPKSDFADHLSEHMQNLEWLAAAGLRHQRVVSEIAGTVPTLPARFATVFLTELSLAKHVEERESGLRAAFARVADADEWGVKDICVSTRKTRASKPPSSGSEYLKRKAETQQPRASQKLDSEVAEFVVGAETARRRRQSRRKGQRRTARLGVARIFPHSPEPSQETGGDAEKVCRSVGRRSSHRLQRAVAAVLVCGGTCLRRSPQQRSPLTATAKRRCWIFSTTC